MGKRFRFFFSERLPVAHIRESYVGVCKFFGLHLDSDTYWWGIGAGHVVVLFYGVRGLATANYFI